MPHKDKTKKLEYQRMRDKAIRDGTWNPSPVRKTDEQKQETRVLRNERARARRTQRRMEMLERYGGVCDCCGESRYEFLAIDHIDGGGRQHVKSLGGNEQLYNWIRKNNYPEGFRVLCHNCNTSFGLYGYCPHESKWEDENRELLLRKILGN